MTTYVFRAVLEEDGHWSAWNDALPGCAAWGHSREEASKALQDAAEAYVEDLVASGEAVPKKGVEIIEAPVVTVTL